MSQGPKDMAEFPLDADESGCQNLVFAWAFDVDGGCAYVDPLWLRYTGQSPAEAAGDGWTKAVHPDDRPRFLEAFRAAYARRSPISFEFRVRSAKGVYRYMLAGAAPRFDDSGAFAGHHGSVIDIDERRKAEAAARAGEARLHYALETGGIGVWELNLTDLTAYRTLQHDRIFGYENMTPEWSYNSLLSHIPPEDRPFVEATFGAATAARKEFQLEYRIRRVDGALRWMWVAGRPREPQDGSGPFMIGVNRDITEQKDAELRLYENQQRLQAVVNAVPIAVAYSDDPTCENITGNRALRAQFGIDPQDIVSAAASDPNAAEKRVRFFTDGRELSGQALPLQMAAREGRAIEPMELEVQLPSGRRWTVEVSGAPIINERNETLGSVAVTVDVTERKKAQEALRESEARFRALVTASSEIIYSMSPDWAEIRLYGQGFLTSAETPVANWLEGHIPAEDRARVAEVIAEAIRLKRPFELEHRVRRADGGVGWVLSRNVPLLNDQGDIVEWFGVESDITSRKRAEEDLRDSDRRKEEFLATLAHELRNPLAPIRNAVHILRRDVVSGSGGKRDLTLLSMIDRQVEHLIRLVDDLLEVSRITCGKIDLKKLRVDLGDVLRHAIDMARPMIERGAHDLRVALPAEPLALDADPVRLAQIFTNLLNNAAKYTERGGVIWLSAERRSDEAVVTVRDSGVGIPPEMLPRVFDLFTQVDRNLGRAQGGLGIGLALVKNLIELHGGTVEVRSEGLGRGSDFILRLPALPGQARKDEAERPEPTALRAALRILVIDDDRDVADSLAMCLETFGAKVRVAYSGAEGLAAFEAFRPELVFLDLGMPRMDGYETARRIRALPEGRDIQLVALTGWGQQQQVQDRARDAGFDRQLTKPASLEALRELLVGAA
jgi:PAS domain S-box-containing protein